MMEDTKKHTINILHICNNYWANSLYKKMITALALSKDTYHQVFVPIRSEAQRGNHDVSISNIKVVYKLVATSVIYRLLFTLKSKKAFHKLSQATDFKKFHITHAHTLFSDGILSYKIFKKEGKKYIVTIRNTDINIFLKYFPFLKGLGRNILKNAEHIVFISPSYVAKLTKHYPDLSDIITKKQIILPNGINEYWLENSSTELHKEIGETVNLIYVGEIGPNKNIHTTIAAVKKLRKERKVSFKIIGKGKRDHDKYLASIENEIKDIDEIEILEAIPKEKLIQHYRESHIFIMPSLTETFGLVYAEALSQGTPIIYTKNEGFDGFFEEGEVGYGLDNPKSEEEIYAKVKGIIANFDQIQKNIKKNQDKFSWERISKKYIALYRNLV
jgi:glycosyltransferase involved in cell wall biosynthesis